MNRSAASAENSFTSAAVNVERSKSGFSGSMKGAGISDARNEKIAQRDQEGAGNLQHEKALRKLPHV